MHAVRRFAARVAVVGLLGAALSAPSTPAGAAYVPSCASGVLVPQLCTLLATLTTAAVLPGDTVESSGRASASNEPADLPEGFRCPSGAGPRLERYDGELSPVRHGAASAPSAATTLTMAGCSDGRIDLEANATVRRTATRSQPGLRYSLEFSVRNQSGRLMLRMSWAVADIRCGSTGCHRTEERPVSPGGDSSALLVRDSGLAAQIAGQYQRTTFDSEGRVMSTEGPFDYVYRVDSSVSGRYARVLPSWHTSDTAKQLSVRAGPAGNGWSVVPGN